jgi:CPA1 family monovalent cation:H+ antiporter
MDAVREEGPKGYNRAARRILELSTRFKIARFVDRHLNVDWLLAAALADRFELLLVRRVVLERLRLFNRSSLAALLGRQMTEVLGDILSTRVKAIETALMEMREQFAGFTPLLERRMLLLAALKQGKSAIDAMVAETTISEEMSQRIHRRLDQTWRASLARPSLRRRLSTHVP